MIAHAQRQDALVDANARREEHEVRRLLVDGLDDELAVVERDVADLRPGEPDLWGQPAKSRISGYLLLIQNLKIVQTKAS